jgi:hypothetical protein
MFQLLTCGCRRGGSWGLAAASILVVSVWVGLAAAQDTDFEPRVPPPDRTPDLNQFKQLLEDSLRNARSRRDFPNAFNAKKSAQAVENGANGILAAVIIAVGLVGLLVGLYVIRRMAVGAHTRRSALDDPRVRAYMLALEGQKPEVGSQKTEVGS